MKQMYVDGGWLSSAESISVLNPYSGAVIDEVAKASGKHVDMALAAAAAGVADMARLSAAERMEILTQAAAVVDEHSAELALLLTSEQGKPIGEAETEVAKVSEVFRFSAAQAGLLHGETVPVEYGQNNADKFGFTIREPRGVVLAITAFNFPLLLAAHKLGPAFAGGNSVLWKPAEKVPLVALRLTELLITKTNLPARALQCIVGFGNEIGNQLCSDSRVNVISFTGSTIVGNAITKVAGAKRLLLEMGGNCPLVILADADLEMAADAVAQSGYLNAGQVCNATQRVVVADSVSDDFVHLLTERVGALSVGDPTDRTTKVSALITREAADRVNGALQDAVSAGARLEVGGDRDGSLIRPAVLTDVPQRSALWRDELFGPAVAVKTAASADEAIRYANDTTYGLAAGVFTSNLNNAMSFARRVRAGSVMINAGPLWRSVAQPYGGMGASGIGREGPSYALQEMTEVKAVVMHQLPPAYS
jgi:acyl-CoA reductase-like NAD-dependent aldehyde dehydrogenase